MKVVKVFMIWLFFLRERERERIITVARERKVRNMHWEKRQMSFSLRSSLSPSWIYRRRERLWMLPGPRPGVRVWAPPGEQGQHPVHGGVPPWPSWFASRSVRVGGGVVVRVHGHIARVVAKLFEHGVQVSWRFQGFRFLKIFLTVCVSQFSCFWP